MTFGWLVIRIIFRYKRRKKVPRPPSFPPWKQEKKLKGFYTKINQPQTPVKLTDTAWINNFLLVWNQTKLHLATNQPKKGKTIRSHQTKTGIWNWLLRVQIVGIYSFMGKEMLTHREMDLRNLWRRIAITPIRPIRHQAEFHSVPNQTEKCNQNSHPA